MASSIFRTGRVKVGTLVDVAQPIYVAEEKGFFSEAGLQVETIFLKGGAENVRAVVAGDADLGLATGLFAVLTAFARGAPLRVVSAERTGLSDLSWYVPGDSSITKLDDVAGKTVAYSFPGSSTHMAVVAVARQLEEMGLGAPEPVSLGCSADTFAGIMTGQADVGWAAAPSLLDRVEKGEIRIAFRGDEIVALRDLTVRVNFVNAAFAAKHPGAVAGFLWAYQRAIDFMFDEPRESAKIWIRRADLKVPEPIVLKSWDFSRRSAMSLKPIRGLDAIMEKAVKFGFLRRPLTPAGLDWLLDLKYLP